MLQSDIDKIISDMFKLVHFEDAQKRGQNFNVKGDVGDELCCFGRLFTETIHAICVFVDRLDAKLKDEWSILDYQVKWLQEHVVKDNDDEDCCYACSICHCIVTADQNYCHSCGKELNLPTSLSFTR